MPKYTLKDQIAKMANGINVRTFKSQPMPESYTKRRWFFPDNPMPSQMQEAFINSVIGA